MNSRRRRPTIPLALGWVLIAGLGIATGLVRAADSSRYVVTDLAVTDKVEEELLYDQAVLSAKVDVLTRQGVVTLSGQVNNALARDRATRVAETVKGVRSVVNLIEVKRSDGRSDGDILADVKVALYNDSATELMGIEPVVEDGVVTLAGTVDSQAEADLVVRNVKGVRGVVAVDNQLQVRTPESRPDQELKIEIERTLHWNRYLDDSLIEVRVEDGVVTLMGKVGSAAEKSMASAAAWVPGVQRVENDKLAVSSWARDPELRQGKYEAKSREELRRAINMALLYDPRVKFFEIDAKVVGSTVTLRGEVDNLQAKRAAARDARNTVGVTYVVNRLRVRPRRERTDREIGDAAREALERDVYLHRQEITVGVSDGTVHLYGTVDTQYERSRAEELLVALQGVLDVENHLRVRSDRYQAPDPYVDRQRPPAATQAPAENRYATAADERIREEIESQLWWSPFVNSDQIDVSVKGGVARLRGLVTSLSEYESAVENAYEGGAVKVVSDLVVKSD